MKNILIVLAVVGIALTASTAMAGWGHHPVVVQSFYPVGPVYGYPAPVMAAPVMAAPVAVVAPAPVVVARPIIAPAPVLTAAPVVAPAPVVVARPVVVRSTVYVVGQPVRNVVRAVLP